MSCLKISFLAGLLFPALLSGQGTLQFNQVLVLDASSSVYTVPAGKVWKLENYSSATARYVNGTGTALSATWSVTNPNPCDGSTSGSASVTRVTYAACQQYNNQLLINGMPISFSNDRPMWLAAGHTVELNQRICVHGATLNIAAGVPYYDNGVGVYDCGPLSVTLGQLVPNTALLSVIEFNVVP